MTARPALPTATPQEETPGAPGPPPATRGSRRPRPRVAGKFLFVGDQKLHLRGITYGPFRPGEGGEPYDPAVAERDFARIAAEGFNTLRLYTPPPRWLLDTADRHGLMVLAGVAWEQHVAFLEDRDRPKEIIRRVIAEVALVAGHPALLAWAVGNEIPAPIVRWHGSARIGEFLRRLSEGLRAADPGALVTYVNYPSTEYLELDFLDLVCFNVFLEQREAFESYLDRLQNLAGDRPLILTELGLDSGTHGEERQAETLEWLIRSALDAGAAGAFVFSWTDEWHRGGMDIDDWHFGLTRRDRSPKPALAAARGAFAAAPGLASADSPRVTVVICTYNGARTLPETCAAVQRLDYPDFEVIVVDDGSTDASADLARAHGFGVISTPNRGLSSARNTGLEHAIGEIVAYLDDDAAPDPHWLNFLAETYARTGAAAVGGPNLAVPDDGAVADAVAAAPGNPSHVLVGDREAEHIPGCNCSFRRDALRAIGGFDTRFRVAGDDVDVCWRIQEHGWLIAYSPAAMVWHHRRGTVRGYLRQQRGYGHAEALLERKWPERYSAGGHVAWAGRLYGPAAPRHASGPLRWRVYHGTWGSALFQSLYEPARGEMNTVLLMPEVYLAIGFVAVLVGLGALWSPLLVLAPVLVALAGGLAVRAVAAAATATFPTSGLGPSGVFIRRVLTALLHLAQPLARLEGRLRHGLTPWRRRAGGTWALPVRREIRLWSEGWIDPLDWVRSFEGGLVAHGAVVRRGGDFDPWDLEARGGTLAGVRLTTVVEEHGQGRQLTRVRIAPTWSRPALVLLVCAAALAVTAALDGAATAAAAIGVLTMALGLRTIREGCSAAAVARIAVSASPGEEPG